MAEITLENVSFYHGKDTPYEIKALKNVNLTVPSGVITGIIGHTGSGKSTMVQLFNGLHRPAEGKVLIDGVDIWENPKKIKDVRFRVGLVMQYPEYQLFEETIYKDIAFGPKNMGVADDEIHERVIEAAKFVDLDPAILDKSPFDLSGGQKRRAAIAGIIAMRPEILVLDEPAAGLDPRGRDSIFKNIMDYQRESGATVIIVSHSMEDMAKYCDNIVLMKGAHIIKTGTVSEIFACPDLLYEAGLTMPLVFEVAEKLRAAGVPLKGELYTVDGLKEALLRALGERN